MALGLGFLVITAKAFSQEDVPEDDAVIRHLRDALIRYDNLDLIASYQIRQLDVGGNAGPILEDVIVSVKRLGSRALISNKSRLGQPGGDVRPIQMDLVVYGEGDIVTCQAALDTSLRQITGTTDDLGILLYSKWLAGKQRFDRKSVYNNLNDAGAVLWVIGYAPLLDYIEEASEVDIIPTDDGAKLIATSEYGVLTLSLSKAHDWLPKSFQVVKNPEHKTVGGLVGEVFKGEVKSVTWTGEVKDFIADDVGRWAPKSLLVQRRTVRNSGTANILETDITLDQVKYDPPLTEADLTTDIVTPVGFRVTVDGAEHLPYEWDGENAVPRTASLGEIASGVKNRVWSRGGLIGINLLFLTIVMYLLWKRQATA